MASRKADIGTPAVLLLFAVFAVLVMSVLSKSADVYRSSQQRDEATLDAMIARQYMVTKLWRLDGVPVSVLDRDGEEADRGPVLAYYEDMDGTLCKTILYFHDGHVYEDFTLAGLDFRVGDGEPVLEARGLTFSRTDSGIRVELALPDGRVEDFAVGFRSGSGREAARDAG